MKPRPLETKPGPSPGRTMTELDTRYFPLILDVIEQGIFTVDGDTRITSFNKPAELITGYSGEEALGRRCSEIFQTELCATLCPLKESIHTRKPVRNRQVRIRTRDGRSVPISLSTAPLVAPAGTLLGGVEVFRDLSGVEALRQRLDGQYRFDDIVSCNPRMEQIFRLLPLVADGIATVLVTGPSGTGKELVARAIHSHSPRREAPFVAINCAAVPETLIESELFGYVRGAFTDAHRDRPGRIAQANGGTLFLDEVGDLPPAIQVKLLRFLQDHRYEPLGSNQTVDADVRIIAATHRDLRQLVYEGRFREDLYYRIHIVEVPLPPLAARREDIPLLARHFIARFAGSTGRPIEGLSQAALGVLMRYSFPGNVRELENAIEHAFVLCDGPTIQVEHLPPHLFGATPFPTAPFGTVPLATAPFATTLFGASPGDAAAGDAGASAPAPGRSLPPQHGVGTLALPLDELEREALLRALQRTGGNQSRAARELGIHRTTLIRKCKRLGLR